MSKLLTTEKIVNLRDLGGMVTMDGRRIKDGFLFRSGDLGNATDADKQMLSGLLDLVVDFRSPEERIAKPDPEMDGVANIHLPILGTEAQKNTHPPTAKQNLAEVFSDPVKVRTGLKGAYAKFVENDFSVGQYEQFFRILVEGKYPRVLWHCSAGKDRTGFAAFMIESVLGIDRETAIEDYKATTKYLAGDLEKLKESIRNSERGLTEEHEQALEYAFEASEFYLFAAIEKMDELFGGFDGYLKNGLHVTDEEVEILRDRYLEK